MYVVQPSYEIWDRSGDQLALIERAARVCYQSEPKGDPEGFIRRILARKPPHGSVLEHGWFAAANYSEDWHGPLPPFIQYDNDSQLLLGNARAWRNAIRRDITARPQGFAVSCPTLFANIGRDEYIRTVERDVPAGLVFTVNFIYDRGVSHEKVRHRPPSFSQESTRYCDYGGDGIAVIHPPAGTLTDDQIERREWLYREIERVYQAERLEGISPQIARGVLPTALKTQIVVTAYWTEWQIIFALRCGEAAHPQMREVMVPLQQELAAQYPAKFSDDAIAAVRETLG